MPIELIPLVLKRTPPWVFGLFFVLVYYGYLQSRTRSVSIGRLALLPLLMIGLSFFGVSSTFGADPVAFAAWAAGGALAVALHHGLTRSAGFAHPAAGGRVTLPGSWLPLALMMTIFFTRYAVTVALAFNPPLRQSAWLIAGVSLIYGFLSGVFLARALRAWRAARAPR